MNPIHSFKIIFAGTPEFAVPSLHALIHSHHTVKAVYTQPDRPAGRGRQLTASPVKEMAQQHHLPIYQPLTLRDEFEQKNLASLGADLLIVVAYGLLLPKSVLEIPRFGCINVHASLLPRWRGAAPIQRAILNDDKETGITIMQMEESLDTGPMLYKVDCPIHVNDTSIILTDRLAKLGAKALLHSLEHLSKLKPEIQKKEFATYANKIKKEEAELNWKLSAHELARQVRAFNPWPVSFFKNAGQVIRVWEAVELPGDNLEPGTIMQVSAQGIDVATSKGILRLLKLQLPGGRILSAADILNSRKNDFALGKKL